MLKYLACNSRPRNILQIAFPFLFLAGLYLFLAASRINLATADLGRHLANGRFVLDNPQLLFSNFYSYTFPEAPFINHHWGSGLVFYLIEGLVGFTGLSLFHLSLTTGALFLLFWRAAREYGIAAAFAATLFAIPLIAWRTELRPEAFSYFFCALFLVLLYQWRVTARQGFLLALPFLMAIWVNLHIYFIFGFIILFSATLESVLAGPLNRAAILSRTKPLFPAVILCIGAAMLSPSGYHSLLFPLKIFSNYDYMVLENQSPFFFWGRRISLPIVCYFFLAALLIVCGLGSQFWPKNRPRIHASLILLSLVSLLGAASAVRNYAIFGLFSIPFFSACLARLQGMQLGKAGRAIPFLAVGFSLLASGSYLAMAGLKKPELGLADGIQKSAEFFRQQGIHGPIFNNYDIGGYLIYHLFPAEKVFVDNRPEAYPAGFFSGTYVPMQSDETRWSENQGRYAFNCIYFYWHDATPWAQEFLVRRTHDPDWIAVYVDAYALILVKNVKANQELIDRFRIDPSVFTTK